VVLLTDFGLRDHYVAVMKGVMLSLCPRVRFIDLTHEIPPQDVKEGAYILGVSYRYFPEETIFLAVVDPGVGTSRKGVVLRAGPYYFVGPDNGLFTWVVKQESDFVIRALTNPGYFRPQISNTFHGRDIFAPTAAHLACGRPFEEVGPVINELVLLPWPEVRRKGPFVLGQVIHVDRFGNLITNISRRQLAGHRIKRIRYKDLEIPLVSTYGVARKGEVVALFGSEDFLEIALVEDSAAKRLGADGEVRVELD